MEEGRTVNGHKGTFRGDENVLKLKYGNGCTAV